MTDPLRPASSVAELIEALSQYDGVTPVGVAVVGQEGISVTVVPHQVAAVDCSLGADAEVSRVWIVADLGDVDEEGLGVAWSCPRCGSGTTSETATSSPHAAGSHPADHVGLPPLRSAGDAVRPPILG